MTLFISLELQPRIFLTQWKNLTYIDLLQINLVVLYTS